MGAAYVNTHRAVLVCPGPDGDAAECGAVIEGTVEDDGAGDRIIVFPSWVCPTCGRTDGFTMRTEEILSRVEKV